MRRSAEPSAPDRLTSAALAVGSDSGPPIGVPGSRYESFFVRLDTDGVRFDIEAISKPGVPLVRVGAPVTRQLQTRATNGYLRALEQWTSSE